MPLIECLDCGHRVSTLAVACPSCGRPVAMAKDAHPVEKAPVVPTPVQPRVESAPLVETGVAAAPHDGSEPQAASTQTSPDPANADQVAGPGVLLGLYVGLAIILGGYNLLSYAHLLVPPQPQAPAWWVLFTSQLSAAISIVGSIAVLAARKWGVILLVITQACLPFLMLAAEFTPAESFGRAGITLTILFVLAGRRWDNLR